ncbi:MAG: YraN family protein [Brevundimonas sp.]|jgi:putative endonuclease|uniref:YraN family protein n=1 Tax=Brevundimonas sp. TaxID=1871086 RepID=UPI0022CA6EA1|nr:YraN family protein [Brevundimonas sp.]MCZ8195045.1 YraN family protein [Brevundimonas sp.]
MKPGRPERPWRVGLGTRARREGRTAEWVAALFLMSRGYRILGFRLKAAGGEIDLLARRGRVLAVVEVKRRATLDAALVALKPAQQARLLAAGRAVARGRPGLAGLALRLDMVALAPGRWPRHIRGLRSRD